MQLAAKTDDVETLLQLRAWLSSDVPDEMFTSPVNFNVF